VVLQQPDLERLAEDQWNAVVEPSYIYFICRRPRISLVESSVAFTTEEVVGTFNVWRGPEIEEVPFAAPNLLGTADVTLTAEYPGTQFSIVDSTGEVLTVGNAATLMTGFGHEYSQHLDLEVMYVGQSFGFEGSRTATDRLRSHSTLQGIYAESLIQSPDMDIWLVLAAFEDPYLGIEIDPRVEAVATDAEDDAHAEKILNTGLSLQQEVNLTEAMLIRHFDPPYNKTYRNTFPNPAHSTYSGCYELDFRAVSVEVETSPMNCRLWSRAQPAAWLHLPSYPLTGDADRQSMFG